MIGLFPVVVVRRYPEDGHDGPTRRRREGFGEPDGGQRLVEAVERSSQQPGLLARGHEKPVVRSHRLQGFGCDRTGSRNQAVGRLSPRRVEYRCHFGRLVFELCESRGIPSVEVTRRTVSRQIVANEGATADGSPVEVEAQKALPMTM